MTFGRKQPGLTRVHDAVDDVKYDQQRGAERSHQNLVHVADAENHQKQRKHFGC